MVHTAHVGARPKCAVLFVDIVDMWTMRFKSLYPYLPIF